MNTWTSASGWLLTRICGEMHGQQNIKNTFRYFVKFWIKCDVNIKLEYRCVNVHYSICRRIIIANTCCSRQVRCSHLTAATSPLIPVYTGPAVKYVTIISPGVTKYLTDKVLNKLAESMSLSGQEVWENRKDEWNDVPIGAATRLKGSLF
jgi:hypothetical protein